MVALSPCGKAAPRRGFWHTQGLRFFKSKKARAKMERSLDSYIALPPTPQNMIDIFADEWSSKFPAEYGLKAGSVPLFEDPRIHWMLGELNGVYGMQVVELGPLEGGHSYLLDRAGAARVLAIESNRRAFLKCLIVKELLGMPSVEFVMGDFRQYFEQSPEHFDLCVASGVLYHMREPLVLLSQIAAHCDRLFLWTHYYEKSAIQKNPNLKHRFDGHFPRNLDGFSYELHRYNYLEGLENAGFCGGNARYANWMDRDGLFSALKHFGYGTIKVTDERPAHEHGPCLCLLAVK